MFIKKPEIPPIVIIVINEIENNNGYALSVAISPFNTKSIANKTAEYKLL